MLQYITRTVLIGWKSRNLPQIHLFVMWTLLKMFSRSEVKGQGHEHKLTYNGENSYFNDVEH